MKKIRFNNLYECKIALEIGKEVIDKMVKENPKLKDKIEKDYNGKFLPYFLEYINTFIADDLKFMKENYKELGNINLSTEVLYIELFLRWLEEEKGIIPIKKQKRER